MLRKFSEVVSEDLRPAVDRLHAVLEREVAERRAILLRRTGGDDSPSALHDLLRRFNRGALIGLLPKVMTVSDFAAAWGMHDPNDVAQIVRRLSECEGCPETGGACVAPDAHHELERPHYDVERQSLVFARCDREPRYRTHEALGYIGVPKLYRERTFDGYLPKTPSQQQARSIAEAYVADYTPSSMGLTLQGPSGTGKTHLASAIVRALYVTRRVRGIQFWSAHRLVEKICNGDRSAREELEIEAVQAPLLVLDDVGAVGLSDFEQGKLTLLLSDRHAAGRPVIITTNDAVERFADRLGARTVSRLVERTVVVALTGSDHRVTA